MTRLAARGTFVTAVKSSIRPGKMRKTFHFRMHEQRAQSLKRDHDDYVERIGKVIKLPETEMELESKKDGTSIVTIFQDDLSDDGMTLTDFLHSSARTAEKMAVFGKALDGTLAVCKQSEALISEGVALGLESNPNNWWIRQDGEAVFFDTTPPLISYNGKINVDALIPAENPTFLGRVMAFLARAPVIRKLSEKVIKGYAFDWPTTIRTFLIKTIADGAPDLKKEFMDATRNAVKALEIDESHMKQFERKLTDFSINLELLKLMAFKKLAGE